MEIRITFEDSMIVDRSVWSPEINNALLAARDALAVQHAKHGCTQGTTFVLARHTKRDAQRPPTEGTATYEFVARFTYPYVRGLGGEVRGACIASGVMLAEALGYCTEYEVIRGDYRVFHEDEWTSACTQHHLRQIKMK